MTTSRRTWIKAAGCAAAARAFAAADNNAARLLPPADEAGRDPALSRLLESMRVAVARRDARPLLALMGPTFRVEFSGGKGPDAFRRRWRLDQPHSELWAVLERLLAIGGTFYSNTLFAIPYVYTQFPFDLDPLEHVAVLKAGTEVRQSPQRSAAAVGVLSTEIIRANPRLQPPVRLDRAEYLHIASPSGLEGYVETPSVYSPAGHRAFFEKRANKWVWISLVCAE